MRRLIRRRKRLTALGLMLAVAAFIVSLAGGKWFEPTAQAATFTVTNTNNSGVGSLRQAIVDANNTAGADTISFNIPASDPNCDPTTHVCGITPTLQLPLPSISDPVIMDGYTQPGSSANMLANGDNAVLLIEINGAIVGNNGDGVVLQAGAGGSTIRGLVIDRGWSAAILVQTDTVAVEGCFLGIDPTGLIAHGNTQGVNADFGFPTSGMRVGGTSLAVRNVISGNGTGVFIRSGASQLVQGNFIGTDATGTAVLTNNTAIDLRSSDNLIGGTTAAARNIIASNGTSIGITVNTDVVTPTGNRIQGNFIGTDVTGTTPHGFSQGIFLGNSSTTQIGGLTATPGTPPGNVIAGSSTGIFVGQGVSNNTIQGNLIGTDATGTSALGNSLSGINVQGASNVIGGLDVMARNVISANGRGISLGTDNATVQSNLVQGNFIGTDISGTQFLGNGDDGVFVTDSINNTIGGVVAMAGAPPGNLIAGNGGRGVGIIGNTTRLTVQGNTIFSNGGLGIDLNRDGVTLNDPCDPDAGPNNRQNFPVITSASSSGGSTTIVGTLNSTAGTTFTIEFYANQSCDASGNGEGQTFLGSTTVITAASPDCSASFNVITGALPAGQNVVTATATDPAGNTSEFSQCFSAPTAIKLASFTATAYDDGQTLLEWQTGFEVDNLGFNIYREEAGRRIRVNKSILAGSALVTGLNTALMAGRSYSWLDKSTRDVDGAQYWLEEVDLKGQSTWHGPVMSQRSDLRPQTSEVNPQSATLTELGGSDPQDDSSPLEAKAQTAVIKAASIDVQAAIASQPAAKIAVKREGWYRVTQPELAAAGFNPRGNPRTLQLFVDGRELPIIVPGEQDGSFDPADSIEFYGMGLDSPFTDSRVYWLMAGNQDGLRVRQSKGEGSPLSSEGFPFTVERRDRNIYFSSLRNGERENFFGAVIAHTPVDQTLNLAHVARSDSRDAELEVALQGVTFLQHRVNVEFNGVQAGSFDFDGQSQGVATFTLPHSVLREGTNTVRLTPLGGASDVSLVDYIRVSYQHRYTADNNSLKLTAPGNERVTINGFTSDSIRVIDVSDANAPQEIVGTVEKRKDGYAISFAATEAGERSLLAFTAEQQPASLSFNRPSKLRKGAGQFVIITRTEFARGLNPLVTLRQSQGLSVNFADIEDIYDEFSFGQKTPFAVRDFLAWAKSNWTKKPRFVLFAGDASYDPKSYLGLGDSDLVPTKLIDTNYMETASDDWLADFDHDGVADLAIGRLPVRTAEEASLLVSKIIAYEKSPPEREVLLAADANDGFDFESANNQLASLVPLSLRVTQVNRGRVDPETAKKTLLDGIDRGQKLVNYTGHGSVNLWRGNLLTNADAADLTNKSLPVFVMMTCLNGYFHDPALDSLAESLLKAERGGAVAVWASSGMTLPDDQATMNRELYRLVFSASPTTTLGEATRRAKRAASDADIRSTWILFGDPTMKLK